MAEALAKGRNMEMDLRKQRESTTAEEKCMQSDMMELWIQRQRQVTGVRKKSNLGQSLIFKNASKEKEKSAKDKSGCSHCGCLHGSQYTQTYAELKMGCTTKLKPSGDDEETGGCLRPSDELAEGRNLFCSSLHPQAQHTRLGS